MDGKNRVKNRISRRKLRLVKPSKIELEQGFTDY